MELIRCTHAKALSSTLARVERAIKDPLTRDDDIPVALILLCLASAPGTTKMHFKVCEKVDILA